MTLQLRRDELEWRQIDDEVVVLDARGGTYLATNGSAALLWQSIASGTTREELASVLVNAYGIDKRDALVDVDDFLAMLSTRGLLAE